MMLMLNDIFVIVVRFLFSVFFVIYDTVNECDLKDH